jgi:hypothetical protein
MSIKTWLFAGCGSCMRDCCIKKGNSGHCTYLVSGKTSQWGFVQDQGTPQAPKASLEAGAWAALLYSSSMTLVYYIIPGNTSGFDRRSASFPFMYYRCRISNYSYFIIRRSCTWHHNTVATGDCVWNVVCTTWKCVLVIYYNIMCTCTCIVPYS